MAKVNSGESYAKATINLEEGTIIEYLPKEEVNVFNLQDILKRWDGIEGISFTIKKDDTIKPIEK